MRSQVLLICLLLIGSLSAFNIVKTGENTLRLEQNAQKYADITLLNEYHMEKGRIYLDDCNLFTCDLRMGIQIGTSDLPISSLFGKVTGKGNWKSNEYQTTQIVNWTEAVWASNTTMRFNETNNSWHNETTSYISGYANKSRTDTIWLPFDKNKLDAGRYYTIRQTFTREYKFGKDNAVDIIPSLNGVDFTPWAWWSASYANRFPMNCTNVDAGTPIAINGSGGFSISTEAKQIVWTSCGGANLSLYYNNFTDYVVANDTAQVPMEVELGNGTDYLPTQVWSAASAVAVFHGNGNATAIDSAGYNNLSRSSTDCISTTTGAKIGWTFLTASGCYWYKSNPIALPTGANARTMNAWVYMTGGNSYRGFFGWGITDTGRVHAMTHGGTDVNIGMIPINDPSYFSTFVANSNSWDFVGSNYSGGTEWSIFRNTTYQSSAKTTLNTGTTNVSIGADFWNTAEYMTGNLDELRIYNGSKSASFMNQTFQNALGTAGYGTLGASEAAPATNTAPTITAISVVPSSPTKADTISCNFTATDPEQTLLNVTIGEWHKNGTNQTTLAFTLNNTANNTAILASNLTPSNFAKGENWSCRIQVYDGTDYSTTNMSANVTIGNSLPVNATVGSYSDATAGHWFLMNGSVADLDGGSDITSWNISISTGTCSNVSNSTSGNTRNVQYNCTSTTPASVTPTIGFTDASSAYTQATGAANSYPNQNPTITTPSVTSTLYANSTATCTAGTFSDADSDTEDVSARVFNWRKNGAIVNGTLSTLLLSTVSAVKNDNVSCSQNSTNTTWSGIATNTSTNATVINALPEINVQNTFTNATSGHWFTVLAGIIDGDNGTDIRTTNISSTFGPCTYSSNSTSGAPFNATYNCTSTTTGSTNISIGFNDSSGAYIQTAISSNSYPNNIPTILNNITFVNATETSSFTANASVQDLDGATDIIATSCQTSSGTCAYVSNSTSANNFTVRYNLTGTGLDSANVNITFNDSFGGTITAPNRTNSYPFSTANGSLVQFLATIGNIVKWQMNYTVNGTGTCTYTIPLSAIQNNTTIVNSTSDAMTNNGNYTDLSWNCNYSADPYLLTFYTENISQSADEAVSYAGIQGSTHNRILLSSAFGQSVNFTFIYTVPADAVSLWLYLCGATTNASCVSGATWTTQSFSLASSVLNKTLEHTTNETVVIVSYSGSTGAGGGGFITPPTNQTNLTNLTQNETAIGLPPIPELSLFDEYLKIADSYLKDKTLDFPNSLIGIVLLGTSIAYDMRPKKDGKSGASAITLAAGLGIVIILATYGVGL